MTRLPASQAAVSTQKTRIDRRKRLAFLEALEQAHSVAAAARIAGANPRSFRRLRERDEAFGAAWERAYAAGTDAIRDEVRRRAVEGVEEPVFQGGKLVGHVRKFSDRLLELEAKRRDPTYRENFRLELDSSQPILMVSLLQMARDADAAEVVDGEARELGPGEEA